MNKFFVLILLAFFCFSCGCKLAITENNTRCEKKIIVKSLLQLNSKKYRTLKKNDSIINEVYTSIKDTVKPELINRRIDSFLLKSYTKKEFLVMLKIDRSFKNRLYPMEVNRKINKSETMQFETADEAAKFHKKFMKSLKENSTIKIKKDSLN